MIASQKEVLAKSGPPVSLKQHIDECLKVYDSLQVAFKRLPVDNTGLFWKLVRMGIIFHDLGKSHSEFQKILSGKRANWYHQRHELFSTPFIDALDFPADNRLMLKLIVAGHHKDFNFLFNSIQHSYITGEDYFSYGEDGKLDWNEETQKLNFQFVESLLREYDLPLKKTDHLHFPVELVKNYLRSPINSEEISFIELLLAAGALKQCDHSASAGIFKVNILQEKHFKFLYNTTWVPYDHQLKASEAIGNIVLSAPTGSGKTEASLLWLHKQLKEDGQGRTFYILPFTASINAMFERLDKQMMGNNEVVGIIHGKLSEYIEGRFGEEEYSIENEKLKQEINETFRALVPALKVATPFQLLKSIFGLKGFEKGIFEMSGSFFIFDEIHAYDPEVTAQIKVLIEFATYFLNVKVCLMTATLPTFLKKEFTQAIGEYIEINADTRLYQSFIRHRIKIEDGLLAIHYNEIQHRLDLGEKVLVVCNTVEQAQNTYKNLEASKKVLLHGQFNSVDRNKKEAQLKSDDVKLLVGTQAIEVSLDIDYDVIFTEPAPLDALLQRFGRVNRHRKNGKYRAPCDCIVFTERNEKDKYIYPNDEVINRTLDALHEIESKNRGIISENELQYHIDKVYPDWSDEEKKDFNRVYFHLKDFVWKKLAPFIYDSYSEEEFEKQFDGVKVLPAVLEKDYLALLEANQFIKAEALKVSITKNRFVSLSLKNNIHKDITVFQLLQKKEIKKQSYYIIDRKYDDEIGLQIDIKEKNSEFSSSCF